MISESKTNLLISAILNGRLTIPRVGYTYDPDMGHVMATAAPWCCQDVKEAMYFCGAGQVISQIMRPKMIPSDEELKELGLRLHNAPITVLAEFHKAEPHVFGAAIELAVTVGLSEMPGRCVMAGAALLWSVYNATSDGSD